MDRLSGGQRRRLDVALGIVGRPELLFLDEPTTGFDPQARHEFHVLVERLARDENVTVLLTTHDLVEAERLADRIAMLVGGRIRACTGLPSTMASCPTRPNPSARNGMMTRLARPRSSASRSSSVVYSRGTLVLAGISAGPAELSPPAPIVGIEPADESTCLLHTCCMVGGLGIAAAVE